MKEKLNKKAFAFAAAVLTFILDVAGYVWHGLLQQPSVMNILYPGFWGDPSLLVIGLVSTVISAYVLGYMFAWFYNKQISSTTF